MRQFTEKDITGLTKAFRVFVLAVSGNRTGTNKTRGIIESALSQGLTVDALLNRKNWERALAAAGPEMDAETYVTVLADRNIFVKELRDEPQWHIAEAGFNTVAEAAHDFFYEVTGKGGQWTTPAAMKNLRRALRAFSLQAILSEESIAKVTKGNTEGLSFFNYIAALADDFDSLEIDDTPSEAQARRFEEEEELLRAANAASAAAVRVIETPAPAGAENPEPAEGEGDNAEKRGVQTEEGNEPEPEPEPVTQEPETPPADEITHEEYPFPGDESGEGEDDDDPEHRILETMISTFDPRNQKLSALKENLINCRPCDIQGFADIITGISDEYRGELSLTDIIYHLADGEFDVSKENQSLRAAHRALQADLMPAFISCIQSQGIDMDENEANRYDIVHDSWDLRPKTRRKLYKLKKIVHEYVNAPVDDNERDTQRINHMVDPEVEEALKDLARLYKSWE